MKGCVDEGTVERMVAGMEMGAARHFIGELLLQQRGYRGDEQVGRGLGVARATGRATNVECYGAVREGKTIGRPQVDTWHLGAYLPSSNERWACRHSFGVGALHN